MRWRLTHEETLDTLARRHGTDKAIGHHYCQHYERHFAALRPRPLRLLEIGVGGYSNPHAGGESLRMWRDWFPRAQIYGLDVHPKVGLNGDRMTVVQGSQTDEGFLRELLAKIGPVEIIIDDGSHVSADTRETFRLLFPLLAPTGIYVIEDLQTSYWPGTPEWPWGGSTDVHEPATSMGFLKSCLDALHYEERLDLSGPADYLSTHLYGMHVYHNIAFLEKGDNTEGSNVLGPYTGIQRRLHGG